MTSRLKGILRYMGGEEIEDLAAPFEPANIPARPPTPVPATKQLRTNLERVTLAYNDRERVLVAEIAAREAELADVRRARDATTAALIELEELTPEEIQVQFPEGIDVTQIEGALDMSEYYVDREPTNVQ